MDKRTFAIAHRAFTFLDEWLFYLTAAILLGLHFHADWPLWPFGLAMIWGPITMGISYWRQWEMEEGLD